MAAVQPMGRGCRCRSSQMMVAMTKKRRKPKEVDMSRISRKRGKGREDLACDRRHADDPEPPTTGIGATAQLSRMT